MKLVRFTKQTFRTAFTNTFLDFEETVKENSSFDFDTNDETVKEADGSTSSSGVGSSSKTDPDDTRKSSTLEDDSLNNSVDDVDALFGLTKGNFS